MRIIQPIVGQWEKLICSSKWLAQSYARKYASVVEREIHLASITEKDVVLNIGCGALPFTAIHTCQMTGAQVIAVDHDQSAVARARRFLTKLGLADKVTVVLSDAATDPIRQEFTVAIVALQAEPKKAITENLIGAAKPGARLVFRRPNKGWAKHYDQLPGQMKVAHTIPQDKRTFDASILVTK